MNRRDELAEQGLRKALQVRAAAHIATEEPVSIFDLVEDLGIELRFLDAPSLEGVYSPDPPVIVLSSLRPLGRTAGSCAHELGHHAFGCGIHCLLPGDAEGPPRPSEPAEFLADRFGTFLLMPKLAVARGFASRGWSPQACTAEQVYQVAGWLGVGYQSLVYHLCRSLRLIDFGREQHLLQAKPKELRARLVGSSEGGNVLVVDRHWTGRPVDIREGDFAVLGAGFRTEGSITSVIGESPLGQVVQGRARGLERVTGPDGWAQWLRVSSAGYCGRARYRHLPEVDDD